MFDRSIVGVDRATIEVLIEGNLAIESSRPNRIVLVTCFSISGVLGSEDVMVLLQKLLLIKVLGIFLLMLLGCLEI